MRVPYQADEKTTLQASLNRHREAILWKLEGLDEEQLRRKVTPSGTSLLGLAKHLGYVEYGWFCETFGEPSEQPWFDTADPEADLRVDEGESAEQILTYYERARKAADLVIEKYAVEDTGTAWYGPIVTLRWVLIHMIEELARHAGHMDIVRELIDGSTGDHRPS
ncbi:putative damage-inducible protein DinB [Psychromicrobium silvestre]|uniref:Putative damage-inducible protein DinB n=1 Tax=Psychromicrobium silvestre TaxID=1645614 RepID=A0A7Y9LVP6_9MICC|nr:DinB family protein [Psychromicrobium silvestre]NYE96390.1 putative damage-inducible protein DinB [Psychromicrobium silvestre]